MSHLPRVNCHVHIFNLEIATTDWGLDVLGARAKEDFGERAGGVLADLAKDVVAGVHQANEEALLRFLLDKLDIEPPAALEEPLLRFLRRFVDRTLERIRRDEADVDSADVHDLLETLRIAGKSSLRQVTEGLMNQLEGDDAVVPLMLDLTDGVSDVQGLATDETKFHRHMLETSEMVLAYPGRVLPFIGVNTHRPDHFEKMEDALENHGFVGVKLYPSIGYPLDSDAMRRVYDFCQPRGIPLLVHTNKNGFVGEPGVSNFFPDPEVWRTKILPDFPQLKVCLAHFGGSSSLGAPIGADPTAMPSEADGQPSWGQEIADLLRDARFPHVYSDVAFHRVGMESDEKFVNYFTRLNAMLDSSDLNERILFGTDFWMIRPRLRESSHWRYFERGVETAERFDRLAVQNPARFLGLPGGDGHNAALANYVRFIIRERDRLERPVPQWLLAAIEEIAGEPTRNEIRTQTEVLGVPQRLLGNRFDQLLAQVDQPLSQDFERSFDVDLDRVETRLLGAAVGFKAEGSLQLQVLNASSEVDGDGILLPLPATADDRFNERLDRQRDVPFLSFQENRAWLKTRLQGKLVADVGASEGVASLALDAEKEVVFTDYRRHRPGDRLIATLAENLRRPRFALDRDDVLRMADGDATSFETYGRLAGALTLTWEDLFVGGIDTLSEILGGQLPLRLQVDLGASVAISFELEDDFRVVFVRHGDRLRLWVRKLRSRGGALRLDVGGTVAFQDPDAVKAALDQLVAQYLGLATTELERFLGLDQISATEDQDTLAALEQKLAVAGQEAVTAAVVSLHERLGAAVAKIAQARVELGAFYQYQRMETDAVLLKADISERILEQLHHEIIDGDLTGLLERYHAGAGDEILVDEFLRFREKTRRQSWGFSLGPIGFQKEELRQFRVHENLAGHHRLGFLGQEEFSDEWPSIRSGSFSDHKWRWTVDLRADMAEFKEEPKAADFNYGLAFQVQWTANFHKNEIALWLDLARAWRAVDPAIDVDAIYDHFEDLQRKEVDVKLQLVLDHDLLASLAHGVFALGPEDPQRLFIAGRAFAAGMPYRDDKAHRSPSQRRAIFSDLWRDLLEQEGNRDIPSSDRAKAQDWARVSAAVLKANNLTQAANWELVGAEAPNNNMWQPWTVGGRLFLDGGPIQELQRFYDGFSKLRGVIPAPGESVATDRQSSHKLVDEIYGDLREMWRQTHHLRSTGALLVEAARIDQVLDRVQSSLVFTRVDGESRELTLGGVPGADGG